MSTGMTVRGIDCKLELGSPAATWATPAYEEVKNASNVKIPSNPEMADITCRAGAGLKQEKVALIGLQIEFQLNYKENDNQWSELKAAFISGTQVLIRESSGPIAGDNDKLKMWANVAKFDEVHENNNVVGAEVMLSPGEGDGTNIWQFTAVSS